MQNGRCHLSNICIQGNVLHKQIALWSPLRCLLNNEVGYMERLPYRQGSIKKIQPHKIILALEFIALKHLWSFNYKFLWCSILWWIKVWWEWNLASCQIIVGWECERAYTNQRWAQVGPTGPQSLTAFDVDRRRTCTKITYLFSLRTVDTAHIYNLPTKGDYISLVGKCFKKPKQLCCRHSLRTQNVKVQASRTTWKKMEDESIAWIMAVVNLAKMSMEQII